MNGELRLSHLQHCLYCSNGGMSNEEKTRLKEEFIQDEPSQKLFHLNRLLNKKEIFQIIISTKKKEEDKTRKKKVTTSQQ